LEEVIFIIIMIVWVTTKFDNYKKSKILSVALWCSPYNNELFSLQKKNTINSLTKKIGYYNLQRFKKLLKKNEIIYKKLIKNDISWTIMFVGTNPDDQCTGIGNI
jgi:hypothetical protein